MPDEAIHSLTPEELEALLARAEVLEERDTHLCGPIRILRLEGRIHVQETTDRGLDLLHRMDSLDAARAFLARRLEDYDRMWDGCGCKIDYLDR